MKKLLVILLLILIILTAFNMKLNSLNKGDYIKAKSYSIKDFINFEENLRLKYLGIGNEYAEKDVYVDFIKGNRIQYRVINPGTISCHVFEAKDGELREIFSVEEAYYREDFTGVKSSKIDILLKEPIKKGTTWISKEGNKRYISNTNKHIKVANKEYSAVEVITQEKDYRIYDYYVYKLGLVRTVFEANQSTVETILEKIEKNKPVVQNIRFYYPDLENNKIAYTDEKVSFETNQEVDDKFNYYFKNPKNKNFKAVIGSKTRINKIEFNREKNYAAIYFSKEFSKNLGNIGSLKSIIIQCIVRTLSDYYNVEKVFIYADGNKIFEGSINKP